MRLVFFSLFLNHHQGGVADELYQLLGDEFRFVELSGCHDAKGGSKDYGNRPYLIKSWQSKEEYDQAMHLAKTAEVCVFAGCESIPFLTERLKKGLLSFDMGERLLKRGWLNLLSPRIFRLVANYHLRRWGSRPLYKLCCSGFTASDCKKLQMFRGKCYKWGYFTAVDSNFKLPDTFNTQVSIMWCARFLSWKHPELIIEIAKILKGKNYNFSIDVFGDEEKRPLNDKPFPRARLEELIKSNGVSDRVTLRGTMPNSQIIEEMRRHQIFLFTSDRKEGWGAVANESMANGCVLVASDEIGSTPYLIEDGYNGFVFRSGDARSLTAKVEWLLTHPRERRQMQLNAIESIRQLWNPRHAAESLLKLIESIECGKEPEITAGPGSKA